MRCISRIPSGWKPSGPKCLSAILSFFLRQRNPGSPPNPAMDILRFGQKESHRNKNNSCPQHNLYDGKPEYGLSIGPRPYFSRLIMKRRPHPGKDSYFQKTEKENLHQPSPPSRISTKATGIYRKGLPVFNTAILINSPMAREPASPIISLLGVALYHRYPSIQTQNSKIR